MASTRMLTAEKWASAFAQQEQNNVLLRPAVAATGAALKLVGVAPVPAGEPGGSPLCGASGERPRLPEGGSGSEKACIGRRSRLRFKFEGFGPELPWRSRGSPDLSFLPSHLCAEATVRVLS